MGNIFLWLIGNLVARTGETWPCCRGEGRSFPSLPYLNGGSKFLKAAGRRGARVKAGSEAPAESISEGLMKTWVQLGQIHWIVWGRSFHLWFPGCKREENFSLPQSKSLGSCQALNYYSSEGHINYNYTECLVLLPGTSTSFFSAQNFFLVGKLAAAATLIRFSVLNDLFQHIEISFLCL